MEDLMATIRDLVGIVCFAGIFCCLPGAAFGWAGYYLAYQLPRTLAAPRKLAEQMGLRQLETGRSRGHVWHGGQHQEHAFAFSVEREPKERPRPKGPTAAYLRVVMEVRVAQPLGVTANRGLFFHRQYGGSLESFETAFESTNAARLSSSARAAMLEFVRAHENLFLRDQDKTPQDDPLPEAKMILWHKLGRDRVHNLTGDELRAVLDGMAEVARAIEASTIWAV